jgi:dipeptide/tripeptide permease
MANSNEDEKINEKINVAIESKTDFEIEEKNSSKADDKYPKFIFLIILNEFCERFSFYGMRTILYIYLTKFINLESNTATAYYHAYAMLCYFTPIVGILSKHLN